MYVCLSFNVQTTRSNLGGAMVFGPIQRDLPLLGASGEGEDILKIIEKHANLVLHLGPICWQLYRSFGHRKGGGGGGGGGTSHFTKHQL